jgi:superfamily II RNA helicase
VGPFQLTDELHFFVWNDPHQLAGVFGAICADASRPASSSYDPSAKLRAALRNLEPIAAGVMTVQYEAGMSSSVTLSDGVAALCEAWASGATWDQIRRDTNLDEGDIARVFRRTAELLAQAPRTRELPESVRKRAKAAEKLVLRPPITDLS